MDVLVICKKGDEWVLIYFTRCVWNMNLSQIPICLEYFMWFSFLVFLFRAGRLEEVHATLVKNMVVISSVKNTNKRYQQQQHLHHPT